MSTKRFVLLHHQLPPNAERASHWDLMLEHDGKLLTWELPSLEMKPLPADFQAMGIRRIADHRLHYVNYEGPVSGGRGSVSREDFGSFCIVPIAPDDLIIAKLTGIRFDIELELPAACFPLTSCRSESSGSQVSAAGDALLHSGGRLLSFVWK